MGACRCEASGLWSVRVLGVFVILCGLLLCPASQARAQGDLRIPLNDAGIFDPGRGPLVRSRYELLKGRRRCVQCVFAILRGQVVRQYRFVELLAGDHSFGWDGRDQNGERLPDGNYELVFEVRFKDGSRGLAAWLPCGSPLMPAGAGSASAGPPAAGKARLPGQRRGLLILASRRGKPRRHGAGSHARTRFSYADDNRRADGVLSVIDTYPGGDANYDASQAFAEQRWGNGRIKGVFREGLGSFDDPIKLFSDFKSERKKFGFRVDQGLGALQATGLAYTSRRGCGYGRLRGRGSPALRGRG
jgi:hypothetical protein